MALVSTDISRAKTNSISSTLSPFSQRASMALDTLCPSKTNHWGWNGEFRGVCFPPSLFCGCDGFMKDAASFQTKLQPSNLYQGKNIFSQHQTHRTGCQLSQHLSVQCFPISDHMQCLQVSTAQGWFTGRLMAWLHRNLGCRSPPVPMSAWHPLSAVSPSWLQAFCTHMGSVVRMQQAQCQKNPTAWGVPLILSSISDCEGKGFWFNDAWPTFAKSWL